MPLIVTGRSEKHRLGSEAWLKRHGVSVRKLVMYPGETSSDPLVMFCGTFTLTVDGQTTAGISHGATEGIPSLTLRVGNGRVSGGVAGLG